MTPHVRTLTTLADGPALDSPVIISGSSSFSQLPQIIAAIRSAPPVGKPVDVYAQHKDFRGSSLSRPLAALHRSAISTSTSPAVPVNAFIAGAARHFRTCPIVIIDDSKTNPSNPFKVRALLRTTGYGILQWYVTP